MSEEFKTKIFECLTYQDKRELILEVEKLEKLNSLNAEMILATRQRIVNDINNLISQGKIDLNKFL